MNSLISASIVVYNNEKELVKNVIHKLNSFNKEINIFIIDNFPENYLEHSLPSTIEYIHNPSNPGFGAAHNIAIQRSIEAGCKYHFIINPDIVLNVDVVNPMVLFMENHPDVGMMMPKILNEDGSIQNLPKLLPNPFWIFRRKLKEIDPNAKQFIDNYELRNIPKDKIYHVPILSGCFTLLRLNAIREIGMYDEKFFMYFEDFDLSRRMHQKYKTIYFPEVSVTHGYEGGANKNLRLFKIFIKSMVTYFNKWGWFFDQEREKMNKDTLAQFYK